MNNDIIYNLLKSYDEKLLNPSIRKSPDEIEGLLADDFIEIGASGNVYNKEKAIETLSKEQGRELILKDYAIHTLGSELILATFTISTKNKDGEQKDHSLRSSIWKLSCGKWQLVFHQGTLM